ncbi:MAG: 50S ribosomal protein L17 [Deltaproteobacteria bacterium]|nr:50S ribosomal protein L17 [Deltaproteobacteria bacterium]
MAGRTLGRRSDQRKALFRGLVTSLIESERITTTLAKAKELRRYVEPLVTLAKEDGLHARRRAAGKVYKKETVQKLFSEIGPRYKERPGGYTRIYKYKTRQGDGAKLALIEFVKDEKPAKEKTSKAVKATNMKTSEKKVSAKKTTTKKAAAKKTTKKTEGTKKATKKATTAKKTEK